MNPWTIQEALVSPGCTLPVIIITFFRDSSCLVWLKSVIVSMGTSTPAKEGVNVDISTIFKAFSLRFGSEIRHSLLTSRNSYRIFSWASCTCYTRFVTILKV